MLDASLEVGRRARLVALDAVKTDAVDEVRMKFGAQLSKAARRFSRRDHPPGAFGCAGRPRAVRPGTPRL